MIGFSIYFMAGFKSYTALKNSSEPISLMARSRTYSDYTLIYLFLSESVVSIGCTNDFISAFLNPSEFFRIQVKIAVLCSGDSYSSAGHKLFITKSDPITSANTSKASIHKFCIRDYLSLKLFIRGGSNSLACYLISFPQASANYFINPI
jgi:hypothetical protein